MKMSHNYEVNSDEVNWNWMRKHARRFAMHGNNVQVLNTPDEFYNVLMVSMIFTMFFIRAIPELFV